MDSAILNTRQAAARLGVAPSTVSRARQRGWLPDPAGGGWSTAVIEDFERRHYREDPARFREDVACVKSYRGVLKQCIRYAGKASGDARIGEFLATMDLILDDSRVPIGWRAGICRIVDKHLVAKGVVDPSAYGTMTAKLRREHALMLGVDDGAHGSEGDTE